MIRRLLAAALPGLLLLAGARLALPPGIEGGYPETMATVAAPLLVPVDVARLTEPAEREPTSTWERLKIERPEEQVLPTSDRGWFRYWLALSSWPIEDWADVERVVYCESRFQHRKVGDAGELGLGQVHPTSWPVLARRYDLLNGPQNLEAMWEIYHGWRDDEGKLHKGEGWTPWSCR